MTFGPRLVATLTLVVNEDTSVAVHTVGEKFGLHFLQVVLTFLFLP